MYAAAEASMVKQKFWTTFGKYMLPVPSAGLEKVNWVNYKTGIKGISFKMEAEKDSAVVMVEIFLKDTMLQHQYFEIFDNFVQHVKDRAGESWQFCKNEVFEKGIVSLIKVELRNVNIFREEQWPMIISFLKQHIIELDAFWAAYKPAFEII